MFLNKNIEMNDKYINMVFSDKMGVLRKYPHFTWYISPDEMNCWGKNKLTYLVDQSEFWSTEQASTD